MALVGFIVNGKGVSLEIDPDTPLLWALRDHLKLTGTKFGCGAGLCGACSVLVDGNLVRSCSFLAGDAAGAEITTIEGLSADRSHPLQKAWIAEEVPQCGYCQSGQILAATVLLRDNPNPTDQDINNAMTNICRCGTYPRIKAAIKRAAQEARG
ncbi:MAG TPA: (2Fe-2S)-binding protein [Sphingomonadales bacterium]|nr:(2Fe-2S)-binding protein [Sphingomonadales bacterium]